MIINNSSYLEVSIICLTRLGIQTNLSRSIEYNSSVPDVTAIKVSYSRVWAFYVPHWRQCQCVHLFRCPRRCEHHWLRSFSVSRARMKSVVASRCHYETSRISLSHRRVTWPAVPWTQEPWSTIYKLTKYAFNYIL